MMREAGSTPRRDRCEGQVQGCGLEKSIGRGLRACIRSSHTGPSGN